MKFGQLVPLAIRFRQVKTHAIRPTMTGPTFHIAGDSFIAMISPFTKTYPQYSSDAVNVTLFIL